VVARQRLAQRKAFQTTTFLSLYAVKIQSQARKNKDKLRVALVAQKQITKYIPHFGDAYWFQPGTMVKSLVKPKVLGWLEAYTIALPEEGLENVVNCFYCNQAADLNCLDCEDSYCKVSV
jgi:hypothetical protein